MNKQAIITILLVLVSMFMCNSVAYADIIRGRVVDSETKEALPEASVKMTQKFGDNGTITTRTKADSLGVFHVHADGKCSIVVSMLG